MRNRGGRLLRSPVSARRECNDGMVRARGPFVFLGASCLGRPGAAFRGRGERAASHAVAGGGAFIFGANPLQYGCYFPFAGERYVAAFAVFGATAAAWDAVKRARHNRFACDWVPVENTCGAEVEALKVEEAILAFDSGIPRKSLSPAAKHRHRILS